MKAFTWKKFAANDYKIPNSNSDLVIEESNYAHPFDGRESKALTFIYKGTVLIKFRKYRWYPDVVEANQDKAIEFGLITKRTENYIYALIDALYYVFNPVSSTKSGGMIKIATIKSLWSRFHNQDVLCSAETDRQLATLKANIKRKAKLIVPEEDTIQFRIQEHKELVACGLSARIGVCVLTGAYRITDALRSYYLDNTMVYVGRHLDIHEYGLHNDGRHLLWPNQYVWNNRAYDSTVGSCTCPRCNSTVPVEAFNTETNECSRCESQHYQIHNYSTRVPQLLKFKAKNVKVDTIYLGCELEFETSDRDSARIKVGKALRDHAIMKSDGSIRNGFEVVTCPATLEIHMEEFRKFYANLPSELQNAANVGMHVHVSRKPLSILQVGKMTAFMNNIGNKKFIEFIAGRGNNHYCSQDSSRTVSYPFTHEHGGARYNTLNLCNKETVEFRIFSTPLTFKEFASKLQFCQALVDYCRPANLALPLKQVIDFNNFISWVLPLGKEYPELVSTIKEYA